MSEIEMSEMENTAISCTTQVELNCAVSAPAGC